MKYYISHILYPFVGTDNKNQTVTNHACQHLNKLTGTRTKHATRITEHLQVPSIKIQDAPAK